MLSVCKLWGTLDKCFVKELFKNVQCQVFFLTVYCVFTPAASAELCFVASLGLAGLKLMSIVQTEDLCHVCEHVHRIKHVKIQENMSNLNDNSDWMTGTSLAMISNSHNIPFQLILSGLWHFYKYNKISLINNSNLKWLTLRHKPQIIDIYMTFANFWTKKSFDLKIFMNALWYFIGCILFLSFLWPTSLIWQHSKDIYTRLHCLHISCW